MRIISCDNDDSKFIHYEISLIQGIDLSEQSGLLVWGKLSLRFGTILIYAGSEEGAQKKGVQIIAQVWDFKTGSKMNHLHINEINFASRSAAWQYPSGSLDSSLVFYKDKLHFKHSFNENDKIVKMNIKNNKFNLSFNI